MAFIQCQELIIKPEGVNQYIINAPDPLFGGEHILFAAGSDGSFGAKGMDQAGFIGDVGIYCGISHASAKRLVGVAAANPGFVKTFGQLGSGPVGFHRFAGVICFDKIKSGNQVPRFPAPSCIHKA